MYSSVRFPRPILNVDFSLLSSSRSIMYSVCIGIISSRTRHILLGAVVFMTTDCNTVSMLVKLNIVRSWTRSADILCSKTSLRRSDSNSLNVTSLSAIEVLTWARGT